MEVTSILHSTIILLFIIMQVEPIIVKRCPDIRIPYGRVRYRSRGRVVIFGCWSSYYLYGEKYAGCFRGRWDATIPKCVKNGCNDLSLTYGTVRKPLDNTAVLAFRCYQGYERIGPSELYCDGSSYDNYPPVCRRADTDISCDFENNDFCKWRKDATQDLAFQLLNKAPPSRILKTGPENDHTNYPEANGYYIYLETSSTEAGQAARLISPYLPHANDTNTCFIFWYHMYGLTIGTLNVYINETLAFERRGNKGDRWRLGKVKLPDNNHFKIVVEATTGYGYLGDIALDDFNTGECTTSQGQTCAERCTEDESDPFASCNCHPGCADEDSCCSDYSDFCIAETTTTELVEVDTSEPPTTWPENVNEPTGLTSEDDLGYTQTDNYDSIDGDKTTYATDVGDETVDKTGSTNDGMEMGGRSDDAVTENLEEVYDTLITDETTFVYYQTTEMYSDNSQNVSKTSAHLVERTTTFPTTKKYVAFKNTTPRYNLRPRTTPRPTVSTEPPKKTSVKVTTDRSVTKLNITTSSTSTRKFPAVTSISTATLEPSSTQIFTTNLNTPTSLPRITSSYISRTTTQPLPSLSTFITQVNIPTVRLTTTPASSILSTTKAPTKSTHFVSTKVPTPTTKLEPTSASSIYHTTKISHTKTQSLTTHTTIHTSSTTTKKMPIVHQPVTVSTKDPKITNHSSYNTTDEIIDTPTDSRKDKKNNTPEAKRWISKYKKKGSFKLVEEKSADDKTDMAGVTVTVAVCLLGIVGSSLAVVLFLRKRRVTTGPCDGAEIVFVTGDELLDFTQASGPNRDSGVYSDTVMSLKKNKGIKSLL